MNRTSSSSAASALAPSAALAPDELARLVASVQLDPESHAEDVRSMQEQDADDDWGDQCLVLTGYDPASNMGAVCPQSWARHALDGTRPSVGERLAKSLQDFGALRAAAFSFSALCDSDTLLLDLDLAQPPQVLGEVLAKSGGADSAAGATERWITVHPNGNEEKGVPIKIRLNNDKTWSVAGGAGGKLNGLRLTHVKSHAEYKHAAKEKAQQHREAKAEAAQQQHSELKEKHAASVAEEAKAAGKPLSKEAVDAEAAKRAQAEIHAHGKAKAENVAELKKQKREGEEKLIAHVAEMQGWAPEAVQIPEEALAKFRADKARELSADPQIAKLLASDNPESVEKGRKQIKERVEKVVGKLQEKHHKLALKRAKGVIENLKGLVAAAAEDVNAETMGDVKISDIVRETLGDSGKGYVANLHEEAAARGMVLPDVEKQADAQNWQSTLERKGMDLDAAARSQSYVDKLQAGAAAMRAEVGKAAESLGIDGHGPLGAIQQLDATPKTTDLKSVVESLATARQLQSSLEGARDAIKAEEGRGVGEVPKGAAVVEASEISHADALSQVLEELDRDPAEAKRQTAMADLLDCYNAQDKITPLVSHRYSGHSALFGTVAQSAGLRAPDPLTADILGPSVTAHVMRRALELAAGGDSGRVDAVREALEEHHIASQVGLAQNATEHAKELLNKAENIADFPLDSDEALAAALAQSKEKNELVRSAREHLGVALGRLEAGAALNESFMSPNKPLQVNLGAMSMTDAVTRAAAAGLTQADQYDEQSGEVTTPGHYSIFNDGENKILTINPAGLDALAGGLQEDRAHLDRVAKAQSIKNGDMDEQGWLPAGFARRPQLDVSGGDGLEIPQESIELKSSGRDTWRGMGDAIREHIAQRVEAGHSFDSIASGLRAEDFKQAHLSDTQRPVYERAVRRVAPLFEHDKNGPEDQAFQHKERLKALFGKYHSAWIDAEVKAGRRDPETASVHQQTLPADQATHDLVHQAVMQDPRLQYAFHDVGALDAEGRRSVREYAYEHLLKDAEGNALGKPTPAKDTASRRQFEGEYKDQLVKKGWSEEDADKEAKLSGAEVPTQALSLAHQSAWRDWRTLARQVGGSKRDIYAHLQEQVSEKDKSAAGAGGGGMFSLFGDEGAAPEAHAFTQLDLHNDADVITAARAHAKELGYKEEQDAEHFKATKEIRSHIPALSVSDSNLEGDIAQGARNRIRGWLRHKYFTEVLGKSELGMGEQDGRPTPLGVFNPDNVHTGSERWAGYVAGMGMGGDAEAERRAYGSIMEKMKGDFNGRFVKGFEQLHGYKPKSVVVPLTHSDDHAIAVLPPGQRAEAKAARTSAGASERARMQNRANGQFDKDNLAEKMEAAKSNQGMEARLMGKQGVVDSEAEGVHRLSIGDAAEATVRGFMPRLQSRKGTVASGNTDMSSVVGIKRQRAIKLIEHMGRVQATLGVGTGKTAIALGAFSHLRAQGKAKRALMAVPSVVQEQFGSEAMRFYDLTDPNHPKWHANSQASPEARRASYHRDSGHDICVVTHQALRGDLQWALANHKFDGDEEAAGKYLESAPEVERNAAMHEAMERHGWDFDMSVVDEGHNLLNRQGKANSGMANAIDAFTSNKPYHVPMSADPTKNDASEAFDLLRKVAPERYVTDDHPDASKPHTFSRAEFLRKFSVNTPAAMEALQREMAPYQYAEAVKPDTKLTTQFHSVDMTPPQKKDYHQVLKMARRASAARKKGTVDVEAVKHLSPNSFHEKPEEEHEAIAGRLAGSLGMLRDSALDRVVNYHPEGAKLNWLDESLGLKPPSGAFGDMQARPHGEHCPIVFAHNLAAVDLLEAHLAKQGVKTARLDGTMSGAEKEKAKLGFSPQWDEQAGKYVTDPTSTVMLSTDAGAVGWNGQRSRHVVQFDCPHTAMLHEQRTGRSYRTGQKHDVHTDTVLTDTPYEKRRRARLEGKKGMRDALTSPSEMIDDSGISHLIAQKTAAAMQAHVVNSVQGAADHQNRIDAALAEPEAAPAPEPAAAPAPEPEAAPAPEPAAAAAPEPEAAAAPEPEAAAAPEPEAPQAAPAKPLAKPLTADVVQEARAKKRGAAAPAAAPPAEKAPGAKPVAKIHAQDKHANTFADRADFAAPGHKLPPESQQKVNGIWERRKAALQDWHENVASKNLSGKARREAAIAFHERHPQLDEDATDFHGEQYQHGGWDEQAKRDLPELPHPGQVSLDGKPGVDDHDFHVSPKTTPLHNGRGFEVRASDSGPVAGRAGFATNHEIPDDLDPENPRLKGYFAKAKERSHEIWERHMNALQDWHENVASPDHSPEKRLEEIKAFHARNPEIENDHQSWDSIHSNWSGSRRGAMEVPKLPDPSVVQQGKNGDFIDGGIKGFRSGHRYVEGQRARDTSHLDNLKPQEKREFAPESDDRARLHELRAEARNFKGVSDF